MRLFTEQQFIDQGLPTATDGLAVHVVALAPNSAPFRLPDIGSDIDNNSMQGGVDAIEECPSLDDGDLMSLSSKADLLSRTEKRRSLDGTVPLHVIPEAHDIQRQMLPGMGSDIDSSNMELVVAGIEADPSLDDKAKQDLRFQVEEACKANLFFASDKDMNAA